MNSRVPETMKRIALCLPFLLLIGFSDQALSDEATAASEIEVPDGFDVQLLYSVPLEQQGSWVCMTEDPQGRLICSDQRGGLYRMTLSGDAPVSVQPLAANIGHAQGLVCAHDSLYVVVSGPSADGSGFYRLRDTNGDDQYDEVTLLKAFQLTGSSTSFRNVRMRMQNMLISSGHGPHGVCLGPDGMLYIIGGNHTLVPQDVAASSPYKNYSEDLLLPRIPDAQGIATGIEAPGGWVLKTDKDGKEWTLICGGLRNAYDLAINGDGELLTFDSDMEFDVGTPWYRPCRINHLVPGGEYGWRYGSGKWPEHFADSVGAVVNVGFGSPTGIAFANTAKFPARYRDTMFVGDWAYGRIQAVHLTAHGASYNATFETFASGKPLAVTDLLVHSDGSLYFVIGGRNTQSGVYRIRYTGGADGSGTADDAAAGDAAEARKLRRQLESLPADGRQSTIDFALTHLNSNDRAIRYASRLALERQPPAAWSAAALSETRTTATIQAAIALARTGNVSVRQAVLDKLRSLPLNQLSEAQVLDTLRAYSLAFIRLGEASEEQREMVAQAILVMLPSQSSLVNRESTRLLIHLQEPQVIATALALLETVESQEEQMFYAFVLRNVQHGWSLDQRKRYFAWLRLAHTKYSGGESLAGFVKRTLADAVSTLSAEERAAVADVIRGRETVDAIAKSPASRKFVHNWQISDLLPAIDEVKKSRDVKRGRDAYHAVGCDKCHRIRGVGGNTGPDLTGVGNRFNATYLLEATLLPSKVIPEQYQNWLLLSEDGETLTGRIITETEDLIMIRTHPFTPQVTQVDSGSIVTRKLSRVSEMPTGLINTLSKDEILDLIAYLRSAGDPSGD